MKHTTPRRRLIAHLSSLILVASGFAQTAGTIALDQFTGTGWTERQVSATAANVLLGLNTSNQPVAFGLAAGQLAIVSGELIVNNATTANALATARTINGVAFDGTANITVAAAAGTLTGTTLAGNVVSSSLTSLGTITAGVWQGSALADAYIASSATWSAKQPGDADLSAIAALTTTSFGRSLLELADAAALRSSAGLGTLATQNGTIADYLTIAAAAAAYQPLDGDLTALAALATTSFGRGLLELADAAALRTAAGLGTLATQNGTIADYLTTAAAAAAYQPLDGDLTALAALATTSFGRGLLELGASGVRIALGLHAFSGASPAPNGGAVGGVDVGASQGIEDPSLVGGAGGWFLARGGFPDEGALSNGAAAGTADLSASGIYAGGSLTLNANGANHAGSINTQAGGSLTMGSGNLAGPGSDGTIALTSDITGTNSGTNTGDVTLAGALDYLTLSGQTITRGAIDVTTDIAGIVPVANLGTGSSVTTKFLRGDSTWQTIAGGGDLLAANNLSDLANAATARTNLGLTIGTQVQAYDADLADLADGSLTGSKVGTGVDAANVTTGTLPAAQLPAPGTTTLGGVKRNTGSAGEYVTGIDTDGSLLRGTPTGGSTTQTIINTSPTTSSSTGLADVTGLTASVDSGKTYAFVCHGMFQTNILAEGMGLAVNGPTASAVKFSAKIGTSSTGAFFFGSATAWDTSVNANNGPDDTTTTNASTFEVYGYFTTTASGTFAIRLRTESGGANSSTIMTGAVLVLTEIP